MLDRPASALKPHLARGGALAAACALGASSLAACGTQGVSVPKSSPYYGGAVLFLQHCSGCHTLSVVGAEGSATNVKDRLRNQGPNFNVRKETVENVLYAIRNGGFSGAIMPQNVVVGEEAQQVARFLAAYAGTKAQHVPSVEIAPEEPASGATGSAGATGGSTGVTGTTTPVGATAPTGGTAAPARTGAHAHVHTRARR